VLMEQGETLDLDKNENNRNGNLGTGEEGLD
jgi:hypothetical protein